MAKKGLTPGVQFLIVDIDSYDKSMLLRFEDGRTTYLSHEISKNILVRTHER
jgi:hypothetical protein